MSSSCTKDAKLDVEEISGDDRDVRILKVLYVMDTLPDDPVPYVGQFTYLYGSDGLIERIEFTEYRPGESYDRVFFEWKDDGLHIISSDLGFSDNYWKKSIITSLEGRVEKIWVSNNSQFPFSLFFPGIVLIERNANGSIKSLSQINENDDAESTYFPLLPSVESYFKKDLPQKIMTQPNLNWKSSNFDYSKLSFEFEFTYTPAEDIPLKLKRMVNEELLHLNKYGVTSPDAIRIGTEDPVNLYLSSPLGEGNWLVSFALWDKYILSEMSSHLVSKRVTKHYLNDDTGKPVYQKTTVEDFPYIHDTIAKTLEIAGLKIWYEVVD
jgi:hypothetical protein